MWIFGSKSGPSGFSASSTAEEVTQGIDGTGLTAIVTGTTSGIGLETARVLALRALRGVHVVMAVRNVEAGRNVKEAILKEIPGAKIDVTELDLSSMAPVREFASKYQSSSLPLNILINNEGFLAMATTLRLSRDNIELHFATNHLARDSNREGRIVNVSSVVHRCSYWEGIRFDKIIDQSRYLSGLVDYGQSKLADVLHAMELARRLKEDAVEITANSVHPGVIMTNIAMRQGGFFKNIIGRFFPKSIPQGAATTCYVALHPQLKGVSGEYFTDCNIATPSSMAKDADLAKRLWDFSLTLTNPK